MKRALCAALIFLLTAGGWAYGSQTRQSLSRGARIFFLAAPLAALFSISGTPATTLSPSPTDTQPAIILDQPTTTPPLQSATQAVQQRVQQARSQGQWSQVRGQLDALYDQSEPSGLTLEQPPLNVAVSSPRPLARASARRPRGVADASSRLKNRVAWYAAKLAEVGYLSLVLAKSGQWFVVVLAAFICLMTEGIVAFMRYDRKVAIGQHTIEVEPLMAVGQDGLAVVRHVGGRAILRRYRLGRVSALEKAVIVFMLQSLSVMLFGILFQIATPAQQTSILITYCETWLGLLALESLFRRLGWIKTRKIIEQTVVI